MSDEQEKSAPRSMNINTACKSCIWNHPTDRDPKYSCRLGRIDFFIKNGVKYEMTEDNNYNLLTLCNSFRTEEWAQQVVDRKLDCFKTLLEERQIRVDHIIVDYNKWAYREAIQKIENSFQSAMEQDNYAPASILVISTNKAVHDKMAEVLRRLRAIRAGYKDRQNVDFRVIRTFSHNRTPREMIDIAAEKCSGQYYIAYEAGHRVNHFANNDIDMSINYFMQRYVCIRPELGFNELVVSNKAHQIYGGNAPIVFEDGNEFTLIENKLEHAAAEQESPHLVISWNQLQTNRQFVS